MPLQPRAFHLPSAFLLAATFLTSGLQAAPTLPSGGSVSVGEARISASGANLTVVQTGDKLAVNWDSFSIGPGASVRFVQPSASSVALNRVTGGDASVIQGSLSANGQVFLINPNGVLFSRSAQVNVGGLVASTLSLSDEDFLAGNYAFSQPGAGVVTNEGSLVATEGGYVSLISAQVVNTGEISAERGIVQLAAGGRVTLNLGGLVNLSVEEGALEALVRNGGAIRANGGNVLLTARGAGDLAASAISNEGLIEARTLATGEFGEVHLLGDLSGGDVLALGGRIDVSAPDDGHGGFVFTAATKIDLAPNLEIDGRARSGLLGGWVVNENAVSGSGIPSSLPSQIQLITTGVGPTIDPIEPIIVDGVELHLFGGSDWLRDYTVGPIAYNVGIASGGPGGGNIGGGILSAEGDTFSVGTVMACARFEFSRAEFSEPKGVVGIANFAAPANSLGVLRIHSGLKLEGIRLEGPAFEGSSLTPKPLFEE